MVQVVKLGHPRKKALSEGKTFYEGKPHTCGSPTRYVSNNKCVKCARKASLQTYHRRYDLSEAELAAMARQQDGRCWVCREPGPLVVDHCHDTGEIRHLLCKPCNTLEGGMRALIKRGGRDAAKAFLSEYQGYWQPAEAGE